MMNEQVNKKKAPQSRIVKIDKTGQWGAIEYKHHLECGHIESRKRPMRTKTIACTYCVVASEMNSINTELVNAKKTASLISSLDVADIIDDDHVYMSEINISKAQNIIASKIGVRAESVDVVSEVDEDGVLRITYAVVFIDAPKIKAMIEQN